jgi:hypothetical protein
LEFFEDRLGTMVEGTPALGAPEAADAVAVVLVAVFAETG